VSALLALKAEMVSHEKHKKTRKGPFIPLRAFCGYQIVPSEHTMNGDSERESAIGNGAYDC
jgi:hypothetical protein